MSHTLKYSIGQVKGAFSYINACNNQNKILCVKEIKDIRHF